MSEADIAKKIGAKLVKNSGRGIAKGDMKIERGDLTLIIDAKEGESFSLSRDKWRKVQADALTYGWEAVPVIVRAFPDGTLVAMIGWDDLENLIEIAEGEKSDR